jgi:hypothetical protein
MNYQRFKNQWKYHYKKYFALTFTILALCCLIGSGAYTVYMTNGNSGGASIYFTIWDFALFAIAYMLILIGNLEGTTLAYQGMLMYVFMTLLSAGLAFLENGFLNVNLFKSGDALTIVLFVLVMSCYALVTVSGIMSYLRTVQYLRNSYSNYSGLRNWCLLFAIGNALLYGLEPFLLVVSGANISAFLLVLEPLSEVFIGIAIFFTITRLKTEY